MSRGHAEPEFVQPASTRVRISVFVASPALELAVTVTGYVPAGVPAGMVTSSGTEAVAGLPCDDSVSDFLLGVTESGSSTVAMTSAVTVPFTCVTRSALTATCWAAPLVGSEVGPEAESPSETFEISPWPGEWHGDGGAVSGVVAHEEGFDPRSTLSVVPPRSWPTVNHEFRIFWPPRVTLWT